MKIDKAKARARPLRQLTNYRRWGYGGRAMPHNKKPIKK